MRIDAYLLEAERALSRLGYRHWPDRISAIREADYSYEKKVEATLALYGGFGTINDMAFSDEDAPPGMTGAEATSQWFDTINLLYSRVVAAA